MNRLAEISIGETVRTWVALLVMAALSGCETGVGSGDACALGDDPMPTFSVRPALCGDGCYMFTWQVSGDATVASLDTTAPGEHSFTLYWSVDATSVDFDVHLPDALDLPFAAGDAVRATVFYESPWWTNRTVVINDPEGQPLLWLGDHDLATIDLPPACRDDGLGCGRIGYPPMTLSPEYSPLDPAAGTDIRPGESMTYVEPASGAVFTYFLKQHYVYVIMEGCADVPPGWHQSLGLRRPDLETP